MTTPVLSVIIVNWNTRALLHDCLNALQDIDEVLDAEIIVVDNGSTDGSQEMLQETFPHVRLIVNSENKGYAQANNQGIRASTGDYVLLLNSDTIASPVALDALLCFMEAHSDVGACSPRLLQSDGTPQPYAFGGDPTLRYLLARGFLRLAFRRYLHDWHTEVVQEVDWVSGACLLVRKQAIQQVGLLDENIFMYFEDNDWCLRMRKAGWKVYYNPHVEIIHLGGQSQKKYVPAQRRYVQSLKYFYEKHYGRFARFLLGIFLIFYRLGRTSLL